MNFQFYIVTIIHSNKWIGEFRITPFFICPSYTKEKIISLKNDSSRMYPWDSRASKPWSEETPLRGITTVGSFTTVVVWREMLSGFNSSFIGVQCWDFEILTFQLCRKRLLPNLHTSFSFTTAVSLAFNRHQTPSYRLANQLKAHDFFLLPSSANRLSLLVFLTGSQDLKYTYLKVI